MPFPLKNVFLGREQVTWNRRYDMTREKVKRAAYTLEYKLEAVRLVTGGHAKSVTAKVLGWASRADVG